MTLVRVRVACLAALSVALALPAWAQAQVWRCGNEYTNQPGPHPEARGCRVVVGGNLSIVEDTRQRNGSATAPSGSSPIRPPQSPGRGAASGPGAATAAARSPNERVAPSEQQARDRDARLILDAELKQAQERVTQLQAEYQQGQPAANERGHDARNRERSGELKRHLERALSDVAAIERELARLPAAR